MKTLPIYIIALMFMSGVAWGHDGGYHLHITELDGQEVVYPLPQSLEYLCKEGVVQKRTHNERSTLCRRD